MNQNESASRQHVILQYKTFCFLAKIMYKFFHKDRQMPKAQTKAEFE